MELNITNKTEEKLLSRIVVKGKIKFDGNPTPSNDVVKEAIAKKEGKDINLTVIKSIYTDYGSSSADVTAYIYDNEKKRKELEEKNKKAKKDKKAETK